MCMRTFWGLKTRQWDQDVDMHVHLLKPFLAPHCEKLMEGNVLSSQGV